MRTALLALALVAAGLAGCGQPDDAYHGPPVRLDVHTARDADACCTAAALPAGAPAKAGFVRLVFAHDDALEAPKLKRRQVEFDPGCKPAGEVPDCSGWVAKPEYKVARMAAEAFWTDWYPVDANGTVRLVLPEPMQVSVALTGRFAGSPAPDPACANATYTADRLLDVSGVAENRTATGFLPTVYVSGAAQATVGWRLLSPC